MIEESIKWYEVHLMLIPIKTEPEIGSISKFKESHSNKKHYLKKGKFYFKNINRFLKPESDTM